MKETTLKNIKEHDWISIHFTRDYNHVIVTGIVIATRNEKLYIVNEEGKDIVPEFNTSDLLTLKRGDPILLSYAAKVGLFYKADKSRKKYLRLMSYKYDE